MSEPIGVGDWVECVNPLNCAYIVPLGSVHLVEEVTSVGDIPCLILRGVQHPLGYRRVRTECFRLIHRPSESLFLTRLMDAPADPEKVTA